MLENPCCSVEVLHTARTREPGRTMRLFALACAGSSQRAQRGGHWTERVTAPFRFGLKELAPTIAKLGSAMTVSC